MVGFSENYTIRFICDNSVYNGIQEVIEPEYVFFFFFQYSTWASLKHVLIVTETIALHELDFKYLGMSKLPVEEFGHTPGFDYRVVILTFSEKPILFIPRRSRRDIVLASSVHSGRPSTLFVCPEPYLSTCWSDLIHSWYK